VRVVPRRNLASFVSFDRYGFTVNFLSNETPSSSSVLPSLISALSTTTMMFETSMSLAPPIISWVVAPLRASQLFLGKPDMASARH
jgi:hypothetical protein